MSFFSTNRDVNIGISNLKHRKVKTQKNVYSAVVKRVWYEYEKVVDDTGAERYINPGTIEAKPIGYADILEAFPLDESVTTIPLLGEIVEIFTISNVAFYRRKNFTDTINNAIIEKVNPYGEGSKPTPDAGLGNFKSPVIATNSTSNFNSGLGDTFKKESIHRLNLKDGDTLIQSRFGQSIRLSGYNNSFNQPTPTLIIRNSESPLNKTKDKWKTVEEDINRDGSTIAMTSGKYKSQFLPGSVDKNGKSNFQSKVWTNNPKYAFETYPKELDGNQIIITSDRLILSSRVNETMILSKGTIALVSDDDVSIDAQSGVTIASQDKRKGIDLECKEGIINFNVGKSGKIHVGIGQGKTLAPVVDGKKVVEILGYLIDEVQNLGAAGLLTAAGPTCGYTPITATKLAELRNQLPNILSKTVWVAR